MESSVEELLPQLLPVGDCDLGNDFDPTVQPLEFHRRYWNIEDPELSHWLYALLACLKKPLLPEAHSLIQQLARRCSEVQAAVVRQENKSAYG
uniref:Gem-associated protein 2-like n=1 Tax=Geotrypetes seraphini TaxID=260995 RepID=A0A6P8S8M2_GEOSA|nr:gem-associated protein 2-like [Geotrypetes seraphini]